MYNQQTILFDVLKNILTAKSFNLYKQHINNDILWKTFSKFMILRYLTMSKDENIRNIVIINYPTLEKMPDKILYKYLLNIIPKQKTSFIKYFK